MYQVKELGEEVLIEYQKQYVKLSPSEIEELSRHLKMLEINEQSFLKILFEQIRSKRGVG